MPLNNIDLKHLLYQVGKTSAFIGPLVSSAIITASNDNNNMPFAFLFGLWVSLSRRTWLSTNCRTDNWGSNFYLFQRHVEHDIPLDGWHWQKSGGVWGIYRGGRGTKSFWTSGSWDRVRREGASSTVGPRTLLETNVYQHNHCLPQFHSAFDKIISRTLLILLAWNDALKLLF